VDAVEENGKEEVNLLDELVLVSDEEERINMIIEFFTGIVSEVTYISRENINPSEPLNVIGVDSIIATEIRNKINDKCGITIAITDILGGMSLDKIARKSYGLLVPHIEAKQKELEEMLSSLETMSEEEIKAELDKQEIMDKELVLALK
jgi:acyl carrier protein